MKSKLNPEFIVDNRRSRKGAWIEIFIRQRLGIPYSCRSRKGAWIEISIDQFLAYAANSRSRKGAWIEINQLAHARITPDRSLP